MEKATLTWLAALIDGEGSIMLNKRTYSGNSPSTIRSKLPVYRPVVVIAATTDYRLMEAIREKILVGQVYEHRVSNTRKSYNPRKRRQWTYRLNVCQIKTWLPNIRPWLVLKGEQADLLLEAMSIKAQMTPGQPGFLLPQRKKLRIRLDEIYAAIRAANTKGRTTEEVV